MNNHGSSIILLIFEIVVVVLVAGMTFSIANSYAKSEAVHKVIYAQELEMMVNALISVPGQAKVEFPYNVSGYVIALEAAGNISVYLKTEEHNPLVWARKQVSLPIGMSMGGTIHEIERLCIQKQQQHLSIGDCRE